ncbi:MAG: hypothetical protein ABJF04_24075 [Reichenbachiella sp.]|uniref:hypothetical protein n=1 Tax=Reichenbachiella sp. TaxID=2184521 RepID=UPI0032673A83
MKTWLFVWLGIEIVHDVNREIRNTAVRYSLYMCCGFLLKLITTLTLFSHPSIANEDYYGLLFKSYAYPQNERTSLDLSLNHSFNVHKKQKLEFELSMWQADKFGYIFRSLSQDNNKLDLIYLPHEAEGPTLKLVFNESQELISLSVPAEKMARNQWHSIQLNFEEGIQLKLNDTTIFHRQPYRFQSLTFGLNKNTSNQTFEIPPFALKNIIYTADEKVLHQWLLNEKAEQTAHDEIGNWHIQISNPSWIRSKYFNWEEKATLNGDMMPGLVYNADNQSINIISNDRIERYFIPHSFQDVISYNASLTVTDPAKKGIYNYLTHELLLYDLQPTGMHIYQDTESSWIPLNDKKEVKQQIWKHSAFINPLDSSLYVFGGYGFFTMKNDLWKFDRTDQNWKQVPLSGDKIWPRYHVSVGKGLKPGQFYIFGGIGNESGKQELGQQNFYDLFQIDLTDSTVSKIWELDPPDNHFLPTNNLVVNPSDSSFYGLCYRNFDTDGSLALIRFSLHKPTYEVVSDSIPYSATRMDYSDVLLSLNKPTKELFAAVKMSDDRKQSETKIYSLLFPPYHLDEGEPKNATSFFAKHSKQLSWTLFVLFALLSFFVIKKVLQVKSNQPIKYQPTKGSSTPATNTQIYLLGGFTIIHRGKDLSKLFSPKLRELMILLLLTNTGELRGIGTKTLTHVLWPLMDPAKAKNSRGVTIQRLRQVLEKIGGMELRFSNDKWSLNFREEVYCDVLDYYTLKYRYGEQFPMAALQQMIALLKRGTILPNMQMEWLDTKKAEFINDVLDTLLGQTEYLDAKQDAELLLEISQVVLLFDDLNDQGLALKLSALTNLGKHGLAKTEFDRFQEKYKKVFDEAYPKSFHDLIH